MLRTILFDLDGTLLPIDTDQFVAQYMKALSAHIGHRVPPARLVEQIMASTYAMIRDTSPERTNAEVFAADFFPKVGWAESELMPVFDEFYRLRFPALRSTCPGLPGVAREVVQSAVDLGYDIALTTNPLFPREAIEERMRWIGVLDMPWRLITTYEVMHACKPQPAYYREVLTMLDRQPEECLVVGNDVEEDGAAAKLGIPVFFVTDYLISRNGTPLPPDSSGTLAEFGGRLRRGFHIGQQRVK
ncbi:MAG TPA: HAD family hydrolase [Symbiobacteriaceae bacterium]|nr:HAD family hydrolase [Symbiobacteriaceae bacterium]